MRTLPRDAGAVLTDIIDSALDMYFMAGMELTHIMLGAFEHNQFEIELRAFGMIGSFTDVEEGATYYGVPVLKVDAKRGMIFKVKKRKSN